MKTAFFIFGILAAVLVTDDKPELKMMSSENVHFVEMNW